jgi:hypothetical protein
MGHFFTGPDSRDCLNMVDKSTIVVLLSVGISVISLSVSAVGYWLKWVRQGRLSMPKPTLIYFGYDAESRLTPKVFLRTLVYSTSARGQVIEGMFVKPYYARCEQDFSFWAYG